MTAELLNCAELFMERAKDRKDQMALWLPGAPKTTFGELGQLAASAQAIFRARGLEAGDSILLVDGLGSRLYAAVLGALGMGISVILVEPWMPIARIDDVIRLVKPKLFLSNWLGKAWGSRVPEIRSIAHWESTRFRDSLAGLRIEKVPAGLPGIITFTSGTTGKPKGVVRTQGYLIDQYRVLSSALGLENYRNPDLCIFANFALANLAAGRGSVIVPPAWKLSHLQSVAALTGDEAPESATAGPAFLLRLMSLVRRDSGLLRGLKSFHVGGALTDCWIFEEAMRRWPEAHFSHVYGSSEAEPVATGDLREAVRESVEAGYFQTLRLGKPVAQIQAENRPEGLWISGPHVCPRYIGNDQENAANKRTDSSGVVWHFMGDRIVEKNGAWWYGGRSQQRPEDFDLEQKVYSALRSSKAFVHRDAQGRRFLVGERLAERRTELLRRFPELDGVLESRIVRDHRHRARIDRAKSLKKGPPWNAG